MELANVKQFNYEIFDGVPANAPFDGDFMSGIGQDFKDTTAQPEVVQEQAPPPAPTFSAEELELGKNLAREEGMQQGYADAKKQFEEQQAEKSTKLDELITSLNARINGLERQIEARKDLLTRDIATLAVNLAKHICAELPEEAIVKQAERAIGEALAGLDETQKIKISVNPKNAAELNDKFTGITLKASEDILPGDYRIEWQNGYLERDIKKLWGDIEQLLDKHFVKTETQEEVIQEIQTETNEINNENN